MVGCEVLVSEYEPSSGLRERVARLEASTAGELLGLLGLGEGEAAVYHAGRRLESGEPLPRSGGCRVAVLKPPAGVLLVALAGPRDSVSLDELSRAMYRRAAPLGGGALVVFAGFVKGYAGGASVESLEYEAVEELALEKLREIAEKYSSVPGVIDVAVVHRYGRLEPGEPTVYVLVTATTRGVAFHTAALVLEEVKHRAPIYKLEKRSDGEYWILGDGTRIPRRGGEA